MQPLSVIALFCEDIREEKSGQDTLVGTLPDNLNIGAMPTGAPPTASHMLPKLGLYLRINLDSKGDVPKDVSAKLLGTDNAIMASAGWEQAVIDKAFSDSRANDVPLAGLLLKIVGGPFPIREAGKIIAIATVDGMEHVAGVLNVVIAPAASASPPPVLQSPSALS
jgi:hypothetical protein